MLISSSTHGAHSSLGRSGPSASPNVPIWAPRGKQHEIQNMPTNQPTPSTCVPSHLSLSLSLSISLQLLSSGWSFRTRPIRPKLLFVSFFPRILLFLFFFPRFRGSFWCGSRRSMTIDRETLKKSERHSSKARSNKTSETLMDSART